jgi:RHS repeat-associated protein
MNNFRLLDPKKYRSLWEKIKKSSRHRSSFVLVALLLVLPALPFVIGNYGQAVGGSVKTGWTPAPDESSAPETVPETVPQIAETAAVGTLPGSLSVSSTGSASYSIPIEVPPGIRDMAPTLGLHYSSTAGDGLLGKGFMISGFSTIGRCVVKRKWLSHEPALRYDLNDQYCLDGMLLVKIPGSQDEYRTEIEGFSRITSIGTQGQGPISWLVESRDGRKREYGNTQDSRIEAIFPEGVPVALHDSVRAWNLNQVTDRSGNSYRYTYFEDGVSGNDRPKDISYTYPPSSDRTPPYRVEFEYEDRPLGDIATVKKFAGAGYSSIPVRLNQIVVRLMAHPQQTIRSYRFNYRDSLNVRGSSVIEGISLCSHPNGETVCLPETKFTWLDGAPQLDSPTPLTNKDMISKQLNSDDWLNYNNFLGDFNGDGLADVFYSNSTGSKFCAGTTEGLANNMNDCSSSDIRFIPGTDQLLTGDFNADGVTDIMKIAPDQFEFCDSSAITSGAACTVPLTRVNNNYLMDAFAGLLLDDSKTTMGDFNGDSVADLLVVTGTLGYPWLLCPGPDFLEAISQQSCFEVFPPLIASEIEIYVSDFDGDRMSDLFYTRDEGGTAGGQGVCQFVKVESGYELECNIIDDGNGGGTTCLDTTAPAADTCLIKTGGNWRSDSDTRIGDFNGDGYSDLLRINRDDLAKEIHLDLCTGPGILRMNNCERKQTIDTSHFTPSSSAPLSTVFTTPQSTRQPEIAGNASTPTGERAPAPEVTLGSNHFTGDFDGNGTTDIVQFLAGDIRFCPGPDFTCRVVAETADLVRTGLTGDFNNDGIDDLLIYEQITGEMYTVPNNTTTTWPICSSRYNQSYRVNSDLGTHGIYSGSVPYYQLDSLRHDGNRAERVGSSAYCHYRANFPGATRPEPSVTGTVTGKMKCQGTSTSPFGVETHNGHKRCRNGTARAALQQNQSSNSNVTGTHWLTSSTRNGRLTFSGHTGQLRYAIPASGGFPSHYHRTSTVPSVSQVCVGGYATRGYCGTWELTYTWRNVNLGGGTRRVAASTRETRVRSSANDSSTQYSSVTRQHPDRIIPRIYSGQTGLSGLIGSVENGAGKLSTIDYKRMTDTRVYEDTRDLWWSIYEGQESGFPVVSVKSKAPVVSALELPDATGSANYFRQYKYFGLRYDTASRTSLGFKGYEELDTRSDTWTLRQFHQGLVQRASDSKYELVNRQTIGRLVTTHTLLAPGGVRDSYKARYHSHRVMNSWGLHRSDRCDDFAGGPPTLPYGTSCPVWMVYPRHKETRVMVPGSDVFESGINVSAEDLDLFGNPRLRRTIIQSRVNPNENWEDTTHTEYQNDTSNWVLGLPLREAKNKYLTRANLSQSTIPETVTEYEYVVSNSNPHGYVSLMTEFSDGLPEHSAQELETTYRYTANGLPANILVNYFDNQNYRRVRTFWDGQFGTAQRVRNFASFQDETTYRYDRRFGKVISSVDPIGIETTAQFDGFGRQVHSKKVGDAGITTRHESCDNVDVDCYDYLAWTKVSTLKEGSAPVVQYFDRLGQLLATNIEYTGRRLRTEQEYDAQGRVVAQLNWYGEGDTPGTSRTEYDEYGRKLSQTDEAGLVTNYSYAALSSTTTLPPANIGEERLSITRRMDAAGNILEVTGTDNISMYTYDAASRLLMIESTGGLPTKMKYDLRGNRIRLNDPASGIKESEYDSYGQEVRSCTVDPFRYSAWTNTMGRCLYSTESSYNRVGARVELVNYEGSELKEKWSWRYDSIGRPFRVSNLNRSYEKSFLYDDSGRLYSEILTLDGLSARATKTYYDGYGRRNRQSVTALSGNIDVKTFHNDDGLIDEISVGDQTIWSLTEFDSRMRIQKALLGNGLTISKAYTNLLGRLENNKVYFGDPSGGVLEMDYSYDGLGRVSSRQRANSNIDTPSITEAFSYDLQGQLIWSNVSDGVNESEHHYAYEISGNPICMGATQAGLTTEVACLNAGGMFYRYENLSNPHAVTDVTKDGDTGPIDFVYDYDQNGNMVQRTENPDTESEAVRTLVMNSYGKVSSIDEGEQLVTFEYGPAGSVYLRNDNEVKHYMLDYGVELIERPGEKELRMNVPLPDGTALLYTEKEVVGGEVLFDPSHFKYLHPDHLGSIVLVSDSVGDVVEEYAYDPFGRHRDPVNGQVTLPSEVSGRTQDTGYTGQKEISKLELMNYKARLYDPVIARFLQPDVLIQSPLNALNFNRYTYVMNNPINLIDPSGNSSVSANYLNWVASLPRAQRQAHYREVGYYTIPGTNIIACCLNNPNSGIDSYNSVIEPDSTTTSSTVASEEFSNDYYAALEAEWGTVVEAEWGTVVKNVISGSKRLVGVAKALHPDNFSFINAEQGGRFLSNGMRATVNHIPGAAIFLKRFGLGIGVSQIASGEYEAGTKTLVKSLVVDTILVAGVAAVGVLMGVSAPVAGLAGAAFLALDLITSHAHPDGRSLSGDITNGAVGLGTDAGYNFIDHYNKQVAESYYPRQ